VVAVGRILRFDDARGYGFIVPDAGGEDVFFHANDFGDQRHLVHAGMRVEYETEESDRGLKVASVRILNQSTSAAADRGTAAGRAKTAVAGEDDGMCDVLAPGAFRGEVTDVLIERVPSLTGAQITQIRQCLVELARSHGWVDG
jgi:CspA family cold shock protein